MASDVSVELHATHSSLKEDLDFVTKNQDEVIPLWL